MALRACINQQAPLSLLLLLLLLPLLLPPPPLPPPLPPPPSVSFPPLPPHLLAVGERITLVWSLSEPQCGLDLTSLSRLFGATAAIITRHE